MHSESHNSHVDWQNKLQNLIGSHRETLDIDRVRAVGAFSVEIDDVRSAVQRMEESLARDLANLQFANDAKAT